MKAAVLHGPGDVRFEQVEMPILAEGEALMRVRACGICGSDLHTYRHGLFEGLGVEVEGGRVLGHEFSGDIVSVNGVVGNLKQGDRVCAVGMGGNAEFIRISSSMAALARPFSPTISYEEAATTEPLATSLHAVNIAKPKDGETHIVIGAGIIGLGVVQCLRAEAPGARVIVVDISDKRLAMATQLGADDTVNAATSNTVERIFELTGKTELGLVDTAAGEVDTVFDCAGAGKNSTGPSVLSQALDVVRFGGQVIVVAVFEKAVELDFNIVVRKDLRIHGSWAWNADEFAQAAELIDSGKIDRRPLISHTFALESASEAYETQLRAEEAIKVVFTP